MEQQKKIGFYLPNRNSMNLIENYLNNDFANTVPQIKLKTND